jgi:hypothetical protein
MSNSMIVNLVLISSLIQLVSLVAADPIKNDKPKPKRGLYSFVDNEEFVHPIPPSIAPIPTQKIHVPVAIPHPHPTIITVTPTPLTPVPPKTRNSILNTNVLDFDDETFIHWFNKLNGYNPYYGPPPPPIPPQPNHLFGSGYRFVNYGYPINNHLPSEQGSYVTSDGRLVKQYSVMETIDDIPNQAELSRPTGGFFPTQLPPRVPFFPAQNPNSFPQFDAENRPVPTFLNKNHGPIALGSGALGYIRRPNGEVFLGSGSLGYVSHKNHYDMVLDINSRRQKNRPSGPLVFGHRI